MAADAGGDLMIEVCGTCATWKPPVYRKASQTQIKSEEAECLIFKKAKDAEAKPESWCYKEASPEQLASRVKAGVLKVIAL